MHKPRDLYLSGDDAKLVRMKRQGHSAEEIAVELDRTEGSIRNRARALGVSWSHEVGFSQLSSGVTHNGFKDGEMKQRENDQKFQTEMAKAFVRGDHLPAGVERPLVLIG